MIAEPTTNDQPPVEALPQLTEAEAITEAIEALREKAMSFHFDIRAARMMGDHVPMSAKLGVQKQAKALAAMKVLQGMNWWEGGQVDAG